MLTIREEIELYGTDFLSNIGIIEGLTGVKKEVISEMFREYKTIERVINNAEFFKDQLTKVQLSKFKLLEEYIKRIGKVKVDNERLNSPEKVYEDYLKDLKNEDQEIFRLVLVNSKNIYVKTVDVFKGTSNQCVVSAREVFREALKYDASGMFLAHNHPSGVSTPSPEDIMATERIIKSGKTLGVRVIDHIIVGKDSFYSLKRSGRCF